MPCLAAAHGAIRDATEQARRDDAAIRSSTQASVALRVPDARVRAALARFGEGGGAGAGLPGGAAEALEEVFVVGRVVLLDEGDAPPQSQSQYTAGFAVGGGPKCTVWVAPETDRHKCERCWRYVVEEAEKELCGRCEKVVAEG